MKNEALYKRTCDILFDAYFNDTLRHNNCMACAVGNIVAANMGYVYNTDNRDQFLVWKNCIRWGWNIIVWSLGEKSDELGDEQVKSTGYSPFELREIEKAFERCNGGVSTEDKMFNGLCAVIEVLNKIHEVEEDNQTERFSNHYKSKIQSQ